MTEIVVSRGLKVETKGDFYFRRNLQGTANESLVRVNFADLEGHISSIDDDLAYIAASLFNYERYLKDEEKPPAERISITVRDPQTLGNPQVEGILHDLVSFLLKVDTEIKIVGAKGIRPVSRRNSEQFGSVCLFSGGIDSLAGISLAREKFGPTHGVFVHHDGLGGIVEELQNRCLNSLKIRVHNLGTQTGPRGLQQTRGFLYMVFGGIAAHLHGTENIVVSEVGHTMFQPELSALDEVTLTTHPILVRLTKDLLKLALKQNFNYFEPFSNLTKAEAISLCPFKDAISLTNSCRTTRWAHSSVSHCGQYYGCLVRRMSCLVAGVDDAKYAADVLLKGAGEDIVGRKPGSTIDLSHFENLYGLLRFARDIMDDKLDDTANLKIKTYSKQNLYRRFALDMLSSLYLIYDKEKVGHNKWVQRFYGECISDGIISSEIASNRIDEVRSMRHRADFTSVI